MGLFADTLHDAQRPIAGGWLRRAATEEAEAVASEEEIAQDRSGMQTVFRFQKEGQALPREASSHTGGVNSRLPGGDPMSAVTEAERPRPSATNVGLSDISAKGDIRESDLTSGHVEHSSPGEVEVAYVKSESKSHQSVVLPGPIEAELVREQQSDIPQGGERFVSQRRETFLSRPTGRGAPSETSPSTASPRAARGGETLSVLDRGRDRDLDPGFAAATTAPRNHAVAYDEPGQAREPAPFPGAAPPATGLGVDAQPPRRGGFAAAAARASVQPAQPALIIGRIDVVVVANGAPAPVAAAPRSDSGFLSRNYLKRL